MEKVVALVADIGTLSQLASELIHHLPLLVHLGLLFHFGCFDFVAALVDYLPRHSFFHPLSSPIDESSKSMSVRNFVAFVTVEISGTGMFPMRFLGVLLLTQACHTIH